MFFSVCSRKLFQLAFVLDEEELECANVLLKVDREVDNHVFLFYVKKKKRKKKRGVCETVETQLQNYR